MGKFNLHGMEEALPGAGPGGRSAAYESEERLIIALDFGTTFSGIAYCFPNQANAKVAAVDSWPGSSPFSHDIISPSLTH